MWVPSVPSVITDVGICESTRHTARFAIKKLKIKQDACFEAPFVFVAEITGLYASFNTYMCIFKPGTLYPKSV